MFPWSPEFIWDAAHVAFFGAFYAVVMVVGGMLVTAALRARRGLGHAEAVAWHADFEDLPASARACRHQLTGEAPGRTCDNGFDCRKCAVHPTFMARPDASCQQCAARLAPGTISSAVATSLPRSSEPTMTAPTSVQTAPAVAPRLGRPDGPTVAVPTPTPTVPTAAPHIGRSGGRPVAVLEPNAFVEQFGLSIPLDRYYHRGHTWVRPEADGTVTFGLDALGQRLVGTPERLELPAVGAGLTVNGIGMPHARRWQRGEGPGAGGGRGRRDPRRAEPTGCSALGRPEFPICAICWQATRSGDGCSGRPSVWSRSSGCARSVEHWPTVASSWKT